MEKQVREYMRKNAAKGGRAVKKKYGKGYFSKLRKDGWAKRKELEKQKERKRAGGG